MSQALFDIEATSPYPHNWPHHGKATGYKYGCRCPRCRQHKANERQDTAAFARLGDIRTCRRCQQQYDRVKDYDAGTKYCGDCRRDGVAYEVKKATRDKKQGACDLCGTAMRASAAMWTICGPCQQQLPDYVWRQLRHHHAPISFVRNVINNPTCQICGIDLIGRAKDRRGKHRSKMHMDHDHSCCDDERSCGKCLRGILCEAHNTGLGKFNDNPELLESAAQYLRTTRP